LRRRYGVNRKGNKDTKRQEEVVEKKIIVFSRLGLVKKASKLVKKYSVNLCIK
jgi:hypothetical protein